ncbi:MAG: glycosyltransferase family 1 protein [Bacteroidota bacterium]
MKIGIAAFHLFRSNKHGMDIAALELIKELSSLKLPHTFYIFSMHGPDDHLLDHLPGIKVIHMPKVPYPVAEQVVLPLLAHYYGLDLLHCTTNTAPLLCAVPTVTTLHDVIFLEYKLSRYRSMYHKMANLYRKIIVPHAVKNSKRIITVSGTEIHSIFRYMPKAVSKLDMIPNAIAAHFYQCEKEDQPVNLVLPERYIFFHGNGDPKKNMDGVLKAFAHLVDTGKADFKLLLSESDEKVLLKTLLRLNLMQIKDHIVAAGYIQNNLLPAVYRKALVFLYPGIRESFGLPIIEAMACGTPVITSNKSALPETAGDAAIYINPDDPIQLAEAIDFLVHDDVTRQDLIAKGIIRSKMFSRLNTAQATVNVYESVLKGRSKTQVSSIKTV